jgi:DNA-binding winged helix-turn-helix (wHTH) protein
MRLQFGDFGFDPETREVFRSGKAVHVSPKAFALLAILIERRPKAVSKQELHKLLWPDTFVSDANIANLVAELRETLGDQAQEPRIIRTVQRFGYAFRADSAVEPQGRSPYSHRLIWGDREIALHAGENVIGRDEAAVLWIDHARVSRRHARILVEEREAVLEDLGSKNGTFLGGKRLRAPEKLADKDLITIGPASMIYRVLEHTGSTASVTRERDRMPARKGSRKDKGSR